MKKILLATLVTTGLIGTTVALAGGHGKFQHGAGNCDNSTYQQYNKHQGMKGNHGMHGGQHRMHGGQHRMHGGQHGMHGGQHGMHGGQYGRFGDFEAYNNYRWLNLSDAQQKQMQEIFNTADKKDFFSKKRELADKKRELVQSPTFDNAAYEKLLAEQNNLRKVARLQQAELRNKAWNVLTAEQQKKVKERFNDRQVMMQKSMEYHQKWGGKSVPQTTKQDG